MAQPLLEYAPERSVTRERLAPALVPTVSALFGDVAFPARSHKGSPTVTSARHWQFDEELRHGVECMFDKIELEFRC